MNTFTDLHHHLIWEMDDGPASIDESRRMLHLAAQEGISTIAVTPHIYPGYHPFDSALYTERLNALRQYCLQEELPVQLLEGAEIHYTSSLLRMLQEKRIPTLDGTSYVLVEFSRKTPWDRIEHAAYSLFRNGYIMVVAHPERYSSFVLAPGRAIRLREEIDVCYQLDCACILNPDCFLQKRFVHRMLSAQAVDFIATDAHDSALRTPKIRAAWEILAKRYGSEYADSLVSFDLHARR